MPDDTMPEGPGMSAKLPGPPWRATSWVFFVGAQIIIGLGTLVGKAPDVPLPLWLMVVAIFMYQVGRNER